MARLIPSLNACLRRMTSGERRFARRVEALLEDDYLCWYDVGIGPRHRHPDFVVLHPRRGLLILEVKDWKLDTIRRIDQQQVELLTSSGLKTVTHPLEQARQYCYEIVKCLEHDPQLVHAPSHAFRGRLIMPFGHGVVLANITRGQFESTDLPEVLPGHRVICRDELYDSVDAEAFQERLWNMFTVQYRHALTLPQIDRVRWHLFPEVRIEQRSLFDAAPADADVAGNDAAPHASGRPAPDTPASVPDLVRVMDIQQEQLARSLGDGHRVIHGAAGSGKTLILVHRCLQLARVAPRPVLVLCYNRSLAERLDSMLHARGVSDRVQVSNFHRWCRDQLVAYHEPLPASGDGFHDRLVEHVLAGVAAQRIPAAQYSAVLIDEGHDFRPEWLELAVRMVDPQTNTLLLLYDDAQSIYQSRSRQFSFASVGIQARGRTKILRVNYRNTDQVLRLATAFARELLTEQEAEEDGIPLVAPRSAGRQGPAPRVVALGSFDAEVRHVVTQVIAWHDEGHAWRDIAVVYRQRWMGEQIAKALHQARVPVSRPGASHDTRPGNDRVALVTMHSSKGLEFPAVVIPGVGRYPRDKVDEKDEARLLYVAITRAMEDVVLTGHPSAPFVARLRETADQEAA